MKLLFTPSFTIDTSIPASTMVDYLIQINTELVKRGYSDNTAAAKPAKDTSGTVHPLIARWCEIKRVSRVRCTDGRTPEQQAEYNLRHYMAYRDEQIDELKDSVPAAPEQATSVVIDETGDIKETDLY